MKNSSYKEFHQMAVVGFGISLSILFSLVCVTPVAAQEFEPRKIELDIDALYTQFHAEEIYGATAIDLLKELEEKHYSSVNIDDNFSALVFDNFIAALDGSKIHLLQDDITQLGSHRYTLDDTLKKGDISPAYEIYNVYHKRLLERLIYSIERVENHLGDIDFTVDENINIDRDDVPYAENVAALREIWRLRVKNSVLSLKLSDMEDDKIVERLSKRYRNQLSQVLKTNHRDVFQAYLNTVAKSVDPHTAYYSPRDSENFNMSLSLQLQGIGAQLTSEGEYTKVVELIPGGPADKGDELRAGDKIISIGQGVDGEMKDVIGMRLDDVVAQIRGEKGTVVRLNVIPVGSKSESSAHIVSITRDEVQLEDKKATREIITLDHQGSEFTIGVIDLPTFYFNFEAANRGVKDYNSSTRDVRKLILELKEHNVDGIVIDLRDNGGGSLSEVNQLVGLFIDTGATVQIRYSGLRNGFVRSYGDSDPDVTYDGPLAVLVNRASASASEIFAGAIQDYERGIVLGGQTFGKGTVQEIIPMDYGQVKLTRSKFYRISGASTQNRGVLPDIHFPDIYTAYEKMGESSLDGALPWDTVRATEYRSYLPIQAVLPELKIRHQARVSENPDFIYLTNQVKRRKELQARTEISLVEGVVRQEREVSRRIEFEADNMRRLLKGQPLHVWQQPLKTWDFGQDKLVDVESSTADVEDEVDAAEPEENTEQELASSDPEASEQSDPHNIEVEIDADPLLVESGHILLDMTELMRNQLASNSK